MALTVSTAAGNAQLDATLGLLDAGAAAGTIEVRTGSRPASPDSAATGTLLVSFTLSDPAFAAAASKSASLNTVASATAVATGTAGYFRALDSNGVAVADGTVGTSGADLNLNTTSITSGGSVSITSGTVTVP